MFKWLRFALLVVLILIPISASAQGQVTIDTLQVQLWPEFDEPQVLVIYDFTLASGTQIPFDMDFRIPTDATLIAVAYDEGNGLLNAPFQDPVVENGWQVVTLTVDTTARYRIEYYMPLTKADTQRDFTYIWAGDYTVNTLMITLKVPVDTTEVTTEPKMAEMPAGSDGLPIRETTLTNIQAGEQVPVQITYTKTTDRLSVEGQPVQIDTVDENTPGRVSLNNYLPYILGGLGLVLILAGGIYFWQSGQSKTKIRRRHRASDEETDDEAIYCHQCGKRAQPSDRFCRTCGTKLRKDT